MKLAQFKTRESAQQRLGRQIDHAVVDVAELARAVKAAGGQPAEWLLEADNTLDVIGRGASALKDIDALSLGGGESRASVVAYSLDQIEFLPAVNAGKILAIGRNYVDHALEGGSAPPEAPLIFNKLTNSLSAHNAPIVLPAI